MELTDSVKTLLIETAEQLKGAAKRRFMALTVKELGFGSQSRAKKELGWDRDTVKQGIRELETGITCVDNYKGRGRKKAEDSALDAGIAGKLFPSRYSLMRL